MKIWILSIFLLIQLVFCTHNRHQICIAETHEGCAPELSELNDLGRTIYNSRFPPMTGKLKKYNELCANLMNCTSRLDCFKNKPIEDLFHSSCSRQGAHERKFDEDCMLPIVKEIYKGTTECTRQYDIMIKNGVMNKKVFLDGKDCVLSIAKKLCQHDDYRSFDENYDELMVLYTTKPDPATSFCNSSYDKFYHMQCRGMKLVKFEKMHNMPLFDASDSDIQEFLTVTEEEEKCMKESCIPYPHQEGELYTSELIKSFKIEWRRTLEDRPKLVDFGCLQRRNFRVFFTWYEHCMKHDEKNKGNCILRNIAHNCEYDIIHDFRKPKKCSA